MLNKKKISIIFLLFSTFCSITYSQTLFNRNFSTLNESLGGAGYLLPGNSQTFLDNPVQLLWSSFFEAGLSYQNDIFNRHYISFYLSTMFFRVPLAVTTSIVTPEIIESISDEGLTLGTYRIFDVSVGLHSATSVNIGSYTFYIGYALKYYYEELTIFLRKHTVFIDVSFMFPINASFLIVFLNYAKKDNLYFAFRVTNLGYTFNVGGIQEKGQRTPTNITFGFEYNLFHHRSHDIDFVFSNEIIFDPRISSVAYDKFAFGIQYALYSLVFFRLGGAYQLQKVYVYSGLGFQFIHKGLYDITIDYGLRALHELGLEHRVDLSVSYNYTNAQEKLSRQEEVINSYVYELNKDLLKILNDTLKEYILEYGVKPKEITSIQPILSRKYGFLNIPEPTNGHFLYDQILGQVVFITDLNEGSIFSDRIVLYDGSKILCNIENDDGIFLSIRHEYGTTKINKKSIRYIENLNLNALDQRLVSELQEHVVRFKKSKNRFPKSLKELIRFLAVYQIAQLPKPISGELHYEKENGTISIIKERLEHADTQKKTDRDLQEDFFRNE